jgi:carboxymethylenebutenolidase
VVLVVHEIFGLSHWVRAVADQLAADGFIAIAPDLLTGKGVPEGREGPDPEAARTAIRTAGAGRRAAPAGRRRGLRHGAPRGAPRYGIVGYCWGGTVAFEHAAHAPGLGASVVYYGTSPATETLAASAPRCSASTARTTRG